MIELYFDGASRGNGSTNQTAGCGWYIKYDNTDNTDIAPSGGYKFLDNATNNEAEYSGLISGLEALSGTDQEIKVYGDSKLVIEQMKNNWKVKGIA